MVLVSDIARSKQFYDGMFSKLGWESHTEEEEAKAWSKDTFSFWIAPAKSKGPARHKDGVGIDHLAFRVETKDEVDDFYAWLKEIDTTIEIPPKPFPEYSESYYSVFFHDPDGTRLEVVFT
jgi:catechol 2,3-dioxygenase-like lactoylglutathione lyase family enzyme